MWPQSHLLALLYQEPQAGQDVHNRRDEQYRCKRVSFSNLRHVLVSHLLDSESFLVIW